MTFSRMQPHITLKQTGIFEQIHLLCILPNFYMQKSLNLTKVVYRDGVKITEEKTGMILCL